MCHVNILYVCVFNITSPLINIHFLNTLTAATLQSNTDISAPCHQFSFRLGDPRWKPGWQWCEESCSALWAGGHSPIFPFGTSLSSLGSHQVMGTLSVPWEQCEGCFGAVPRLWLSQLCPAPCFSVNKHKTKRRSCQFLDPSPLYFNFLASADHCCIRAPDMKCKNKQSQASVSPTSQWTLVGNSKSGSWPRFSRRLWNVSSGYSHPAPGLTLDNAT